MPYVSFETITLSFTSRVSSIDGDGIMKNWNRNWLTRKITTTANRMASIHSRASLLKVFFFLLAASFLAFLFVRYLSVHDWTPSKNLSTL